LVLKGLTAALAAGYGARVLVFDKGKTKVLAVEEHIAAKSIGRISWQHEANIVLG
jgi:hypothetical protein